ncbi:MAG: hypothetical protein HY598_01685 [Candidatus Omnitrophica bacterium]|nr:hypothetical protein [Candidatus Omnitrophota bacterium]
MACRGVTLVEMLLTAVIMTVVGGMIIIFIQVSRQSWLLTDTRLTAQAASRQAMNRLREDVRAADQDSVTCLPGTADVTDDRLQLTQNDGATAIEYRLSGTSLIRRVGTTDQAVASQIAAFVVPATCPGGLVTVTVTARVGSPLGGSTIQTLTSEVWAQAP